MKQKKKYDTPSLITKDENALMIQSQLQIHLTTFFPLITFFVTQIVHSKIIFQ